MNRIYCISGLGADHRVFGNIQISGYTLTDLSWFRPNINETLQAYAARLSVNITDKAPVIIGLSLGGMLATEIAKLIPAARVFIISSARTSAELLFSFSLTKWLAQKDLVPSVSMIPAKVLFYLGGHSSQERQLLYSMFTASDPYFVRWGIKAIVLWDNCIRPENVFHIHGTADRLIIPQYVQPDAWIKGGSHFMIYDRAAEISTIIQAQRNRI